jgi:hypothetical protein
MKYERLKIRGAGLAYVTLTRHVETFNMLLQEFSGKHFRKEALCYKLVPE